MIHHCRPVRQDEARISNNTAKCYNLSDKTQDFVHSVTLLCTLNHSSPNHFPVIQQCISHPPYAHEKARLIKPSQPTDFRVFVMNLWHRMFRLETQILRQNIRARFEELCNILDIDPTLWASPARSMSIVLFFSALQHFPSANT